MHHMYTLFEDVIGGKALDSSLVQKAKDLKISSGKKKEPVGRISLPGSLSEFEALFCYYKNDLSPELIEKIQEVLQSS